MSSSGHDGSISSSSSSSPERSNKVFKNILSPRRSARLQEKLKSQSSSQFQQNLSTSDYGTLNSNLSSSQDTDLISVLSDDVSNMSFEDFRPDNKENHLKVELVKEKAMHDDDDNDEFYVLTPFLTRKLRNTGVRFDQPDETALMKILKLFSNVNLYHLLNVKFINYTADAKYPPLLSIPVKQDVYCYLYTNRDEWTFYEKISAANTRVTFPIYEEGHYLFLIRLDQPKSRKFVVEKSAETCEFSVSFSPDPDVKVIFPCDCVDNTQLVECTMYFDKLDDDYDNYILAAPILTFNTVTFLKTVIVRIEIVNYEIFKGQNCNLYVLYKQNEKFQWTKIDFELKTSEGRVYVEFLINHFSWFKVVWDAVKGFLFPSLWPTRWMKCQATMSQYDEERFGFEVSVFNSNRDFPQLQNCSHVVGGSLSKLVKAGTLTVTLISSLFEADMDVEESTSMVKNEEFTGQDFRIDFALKFKKKVERGTFGKVKVTRKTSCKEEIVFQYNVQKEGNENEPKIGSSENDRWSSIALERLADSLYISTDENWKLLAKQIGFSKKEIKKFKKSSNPFLSMKDHYTARGGTAEEFITKLYEVHRQIKIKIGTVISPSSSSESSSTSPRTSSSGVGTLQSSMLENNQINFDQLSQQSQQLSELSHHSSPAISSRKRTPSSSTPANHKSKKCRRDLSTPLEMLSNSSSVDQRRDMSVLSTGYLWEFSGNLTSTNWKALGRTLKMDEPTLMSIEQSHKSAGIRECYYQLLLEWKEHFPRKCTYGNLYSALMKENMVAQAKQMQSVRIT